MTSDQHEPSANSPWTRTTLRAFGTGCAAAAPGSSGLAAPAASIVTNVRRSIRHPLRRLGLITPLQNLAMPGGAIKALLSRRRYQGCLDELGRTRAKAPRTQRRAETSRLAVNSHRLPCDASQHSHASLLICRSIFQDCALLSPVRQKASAVPWREKLAASGAEVVVNGRKAADVEAAIGEIAPHCRTPGWLRRRATRRQRARRRRHIKAAGAVNILVNKSASTKSRRPSPFPTRTGSALFDINVLSGVRFTRHYGPLMRAKGFGRIIFISSESGVQIPTEMIHYGFTKSADLALTRGFAQALAATRRHRQCGAAGADPHRGRRCDVPRRWAGTAGDPKAQREFIDSARPTIDHQAAGAAARRSPRWWRFWCSREAGAISGSPVRADGGIVAGIT